MSDDRRRLPSIDRLLGHERLVRLDAPRAVVAEAARAVVARHRERLAGGDAVPDLEAIAEEVAAAASRAAAPALAPVLNATGIVLHTGLGRAPLAAEAARAVADLAEAYCPVELEVEAGTRGRRARLVEDLLCAVTGAEAATVTNNNAAATLIALAGMAFERSVLVSRGELVEIGGSFRLPEVMACGGARLCEVGTTNRTRAADYERAIDAETAAILKVHPSNYRVEGFTEEATLGELVAIGRRHGIAVIHDIGSGALGDLADLGLGSEPSVRASIEAGADVVLFSGDKLLGGPQCGIIVGSRKWIGAIERHPLMRALRTGKLTLAALGATLLLHRDPAHARRRLPAFALLQTPVAALDARARAIVVALAAVGAAVTVVPARAYAGGGSLPEHAIESVALAIDPGGGEDALARRLRTGAVPVIPRIEDGRVLLDLRTIFPHQDEALTGALRAALAPEGPETA